RRKVARPMTLIIKPKPEEPNNVAPLTTIVIQPKPALVGTHATAVLLGQLRMQHLTKEERASLDRKGGLKGGKSRAKALSATRRKAIAKAAAAKRWGERWRDAA